ncbi:MAG: hypothetical protein ACX94B_11255 [Henriciella sp.]
MRKRILPRLRALFSAACATLYTRQTRLATPKVSREPVPDQLDASDDSWLFATEEELKAVRAELSSEMDIIADSFSELRETLALVHGETPFPIEATTLAPCAITHHDDALFEGEVEVPVIPAQEEICGGEGVFLFDDAPSFEDEATAQQHAA